MDTVPNTFPDLFWAYTIIWILLSVYILYLGCKLSKLEKKFKDNDNKS